MPHRVQDPLAARLLADPEWAVALKPFMKGPASVKDLAQAQGLGLKKAHYRVVRLLQAGLLRPAGLKRRAGRAVRLYEAIDRDFLIPKALVPPRVLEALEGAQSWQKDFAQALARWERQKGATLRVFLNGEGLLEWGEEEEPDLLAEDHPALLNLWSAGVYLSPQEAKALQRELLALYHRYAALGPSEGRSPHLVHLGLAPL
ncbi:putative transcriptional regulator [Thermus oshimai JL-2]|jgi:predicted transcriptional regulator|uniref:Putative transcriptional regulator n=1 Tax=Thermus oshimai JL-2 TaxID=751945 RepID=K7R0S3_THEOS|nr:transcriptional regulator [Thermus oshimai]AFV76885.1 putative transcriptional regulator [Thermus oshimai JL-2]